MIKLNYFYNDGFGWICRHCESGLKKEISENRQSRLMREGEAESKNPGLSNPALAQWKDQNRQTLICPRCRITEPVI